MHTHTPVPLSDVDSVLAHLREELLCEQIVSTTVRAERQDRWGHAYEGEWKDGQKHGQGKAAYGRISLPYSVT